MAPTASPTLVHSSNSPSARHLHHLRQALGFSRHPPGQSPASNAEQLTPRTLDPTLQPSVVVEGLSPPPSPTPSVNQQDDIPGNIIAAVVVIVLILGGLIGLVVGGEILRRQSKLTRKKGFPPVSRVSGRQKSKNTKNTTGKSQESNVGGEKFPYDEKTVTSLTRPAPVLNKARQRRLSDVWPIRSLSRVLYSRRSCPEQAGRGHQNPAPVASPQTTWSEFSPVSLYVPSRRTVLDRIPEEREEDSKSQTNGDIGAGTLDRVILRQLLESSSVAPDSTLDLLVEDLGSSLTTDRRDMQDFEIIYEEEMKEEDAKSLGSSAPDMTLDEGESSSSSMVSLGSLEDDGIDRDSLREEVFELRRAQTRSMQMNKGVLLSLSLKTLPDHGIAHGDGCGPSRSASPANVVEGCKDNDVARSLSLAMLDGSFSAVNLDEFPSPPSILPMIPSYVSGF